MKRKGKFSGNWGTLFRRCLLVFLFATCLATSGLFFGDAGRVAKAAAPLLVDYDITRHTAWEGGTITLTYTINNPDPVSQEVGLGAFIRDPSYNYISDRDNNVVVSVAPGIATYTRIFRIPDPAMDGQYVVYWELWDGMPGSGSTMYTLVWRNDFLTVVAAPTVSLTFDHQFEVTYENAYPLLSEYGYRGTLFANSGMTEYDGAPYMSVSQLQELYYAGWEIGSHTVTHPYLTTLSPAEAEAELANDEQWIIDNGLSDDVISVAYPHGDANGAIYDLAAKYFKYGRTIIEDDINEYGESMRLYTVLLWGNATYSSIGRVIEKIDEAIEGNKWVVVYTHGVTTDQDDWRLNSDTGWVTDDVLRDLLDYIQDTGVPVRTLAQLEGIEAPTNAIPVAADNSYSVNENGTLSVAAPGVLGNDSDADSDPLTAALVSGPAHGSLVFNADGSFTYTPDADFDGSDNFTYRANDGKVNSNIASVALTVNPFINTAPVAVVDSYSVEENGTLIVADPGVLVNDSDADSDPLTAVLVSGPTHGLLTLNADGSFTYTPDADFSGGDSFTYVANDGTDDSNTATVNITVNEAGSTGDTFGLDSGTHIWNEGSDCINAQRFVNSAGTGIMTRLGVLFVDSTPRGTVRLGVYEDDGGVPGALLLDAGEATVANGWVSIDGLSLPVTQGTYYWLVFNLRYSNIVTDAAGAAGSHYWYNYGYGPLPAQFNVNGGGNNHFQYAMLATVD